MSIEAGRLRHRILIERWAQQRDSTGDALQNPETGEVLYAWEPVATVYAAIEPLSAREFIAAQALQSRVTARIILRYRAGLDASMRLVHMKSGGVRGTIFNPEGFLPDVDSGLEYLTAPVSALEAEVASDSELSYLTDGDGNYLTDGSGNYLTA